MLERGNDYVVYTLKGAELQETTVCHAEENNNINELTEAIFEKNQVCCKPNFQFSLSPIKQLQFSVYDDIKYSLTGTIENKDFADLVKKYFLLIAAFKLRNYVTDN